MGSSPEGIAGEGLEAISVALAPELAAREGACSSRTPSSGGKGQRVSDEGDGELSH